MDLKKYKSFCPILNNVEDRLKNDSLLHLCSSKCKVCKSTKLFNKHWKKSNSIKTYQQFVEFKKNILKDITENIEVTEESDLSDDDYETFYKTIDLTKKDSKTNLTDDWFLWHIVDKNSNQIKVEQDDVWEPTIEINVGANNTIQSNNQIGLLSSIPEKGQKTLDQWFKKKDNSRLPKYSNLTTISVNDVDSKSKSKISPVLSKETNPKRRKDLKNVRKNSIPVIDRTSTEPAEHQDDEWNPSDFQAQSTQIFSSTFSENFALRRSRSRLSIDINPRDSGIEEDSRGANVNSTDEKKTNIPKKKDSKDDSSSSEKESTKYPLKIIGEEKIVKKYKIIGKNNEDLKPISEEEQVYDESTNNEKNHSDDDNRDSHNKTVGMESGQSSDEYYDANKGDSNDDNNESNSEKQYNKELKEELKRSQSPWLQKKYKEMKQLRLLEDSQTESDFESVSKKHRKPLSKKMSENKDQNIQNSIKNCERLEKKIVDTETVVVDNKIDTDYNKDGVSDKSHVNRKKSPQISKNLPIVKDVNEKLKKNGSVLDGEVKNNQNKSIDKEKSEIFDTEKEIQPKEKSDSSGESSVSEVGNTPKPSNTHNGTSSYKDKDITSIIQLNLEDNDYMSDDSSSDRLQIDLEDHSINHKKGINKKSSSKDKETFYQECSEIKSSNDGNVDEKECSKENDEKKLSEGDRQDSSKLFDDSSSDEKDEDIASNTDDEMKSLNIERKVSFEKSDSSSSDEEDEKKSSEGNCKTKTPIVERKNSPLKSDDSSSDEEIQEKPLEQKNDDDSDDSEPKNNKTNLKESLKERLKKYDISSSDDEEAEEISKDSVKRIQQMKRLNLTGKSDDSEESEEEKEENIPDLKTQKQKETNDDSSKEEKEENIYPLTQKPKETTYDDSEEGEDNFYLKTQKPKESTDDENNEDTMKRLQKLKRLDLFNNTEDSQDSGSEEMIITTKSESDVVTEEHKVDSSADLKKIIKIIENESNNKASSQEKIEKIYDDLQKSENDEELDVDSISPEATNRLNSLKRLDLNGETDESSDEEKTTEKSEEKRIECTHINSNNFSSEDDDDQVKTLLPSRSNSAKKNTNISSDQEDETVKSKTSPCDSDPNQSEDSRSSNKNMNIQSKSPSEKSTSEVVGNMDETFGEEQHNRMNRKNIISETQESQNLASQEMFSSTENLNNDEKDENDAGNENEVSRIPQTKSLPWEKITEISQFIEKESLTEIPHETTFNMNEMSAEEEIFILDVPRSIFKENLVGKTMKFSKTTLNFGDKKYEAFQRYTSPKLSCVFESGGSDSALVVENIRPVCCVVARRKKTDDDGSTEKEFGSSLNSFGDFEPLNEQEVTDSIIQEKKHKTTKKKKTIKSKFNIANFIAPEESNDDHQTLKYREINEDSKMFKSDSDGSKVSIEKSKGKNRRNKKNVNQNKVLISYNDNEAIVNNLERKSTDDERDEKIFEELSQNPGTSLKKSKSTATKATVDTSNKYKDDFKNNSDEDSDNAKISSLSKITTLTRVSKLRAPVEDTFVSSESVSKKRNRDKLKLKIPLNKKKIELSDDKKVINEKTEDIDFTQEKPMKKRKITDEIDSSARSKEEKDKKLQLKTLKSSGITVSTKNSFEKRDSPKKSKLKSKKQPNAASILNRLKYPVKSTSLDLASDDTLKLSCTSDNEFKPLRKVPKKRKVENQPNENPEPLRKKKKTKTPSVENQTNEIPKSAVKTKKSKKPVTENQSNENSEPATKTEKTRTARPKETESKEKKSRVKKKTKKEVKQEISKRAHSIIMSMIPESLKMVDDKHDSSNSSNDSTRYVALDIQRKSAKRYSTTSSSDEDDKNCNLSFKVRKKGIEDSDGDSCHGSSFFKSLHYGTLNVKSEEKKKKKKIHFDE